MIGLKYITYTHSLEPFLMYQIFNKTLKNVLIHFHCLNCDGDWIILGGHTFSHK